MKTKTEQALTRIFVHCDAVASGEKPTPSVEDGKNMARAFLGIQTPLCAASATERETTLLHLWNLTIRDLRRLEAEVAQTLNENAHLADGDNCTLIRLKRAIGWANAEPIHGEKDA